MERVNYDTIAHLYDEPQRDHVVDPDLLTFLTRHGDLESSGRRILDIGCGTGKQLAANRRRLPDLAMVGLDRFDRMLRIARQRCPDVMWVQGDGAALPMASETCDYVTSQFSYQHVRNARRLLAEVFRVLRPGGCFVMTNIDPWAMTGWVISRYFPEALTLDESDFVPVEQFVRAMRETGFYELSSRHESRPWRKSLRELLTFATERHRASQLMAISDDVYVAGLQRLRSDATGAHDQDTTFVSDFVLVTITGRKLAAKTASRV